MSRRWLASGRGLPLWLAQREDSVSALCEKEDLPEAAREKLDLVVRLAQVCLESKRRWINLGQRTRYWTWPWLPQSLRQAGLREAGQHECDHEGRWSHGAVLSPSGERWPYPVRDAAKVVRPRTVRVVSTSSILTNALTSSSRPDAVSRSPTSPPDRSRPLLTSPMGAWSSRAAPSSRSGSASSCSA